VTHFPHCVAFVCMLIFLKMRLHIRVFSDLCGNKECVTKGNNQAVTTRNQKLQTKSAGKFSLFLTPIHYDLHFSVVWGLVLRISNQKFASSDVVTIFFFFYFVCLAVTCSSTTQRVLHSYFFTTTMVTRKRNNVTLSVYCLSCNLLQSEECVKNSESF
jgi:hypothetical protein